MLNRRNVTEEVTAADKKENPYDGADDVVMREGQIVHFADAGDEGSEGAHNPLATLPGAIFSVWHNVSGSLFASWRINTLEQSKEEMPGKQAVATK